MGTLKDGTWIVVTSRASTRGRNCRLSTGALAVRAMIEA